MRKPQLQITRYRHSASSKWVVEGLRSEGKRIRRFFKTKEDAETWLAQKKIQMENEGVRAALRMPQELRVMALKCADELKPFGKSITDATKHYLEFLKQNERTCTVKELVEELKQAKKADEKSDRYLKDLRFRLARFTNGFGERKTSTITTRELDDWLRDLHLSPQSRNNFRTVLQVLFNYAMSRGYCQTNPVIKTAKAKLIDRPPQIFTPSQIEDLLTAAMNHPVDEKTKKPDLRDVVPYLAIGAFAGLRPAEIDRLDWRDVNVQRRFIEVTARKSKTATRRLVSIQTNLVKWLEPFVKKEGSVVPLNLRHKVKELCSRAKIKGWPPNGLRHSFASFHLAKFQDAAALALQMGHADTGMIFAHYRELVRPEDAEIYWKIEPSQKAENTAPSAVQ